MDYKDYYKILGVNKNASQDEIKKAYRKLAVKFHPDKTNGDKDTEDRFKEINEAYEVLKDPEKRKKYDKLGSDWNKYQGMDYEGFPFGRERGRRKQRYTFHGDPSDFFSGSGFSEFFETFFGGRPGDNEGFGFDMGFEKPGRDITGEVPISLEEAYQGTQRIVNVDGKKIRLTIKPGAYDGLKLRIKGKGEKGRSGHPGDLYITVRVNKHPVFERKGDDLYMNFPIDMYTALLGDKKEINTLTGKVQIRIPETTQNGKVLRVKGKGMPLYTDPDRQGDLYVKVKVLMPESLTTEQKELVKKMKNKENIAYS